MEMFLPIVVHNLLNAKFDLYYLLFLDILGHLLSQIVM